MPGAAAGSAEGIDRMPTWWVTELMDAYGIGLVIAWSFWVIISVVLHELAHGFTAIRCGDRTPLETGHMTWNPLVHMGTSGLIMFVLIGVTWGSMPVNPSRFKHRFDDVKVSLAGPMTNLWLGLLSVAAAALIVALDRRGVIDVTQGQWTGNLQLFFMFGAILNFVLFALNLIPIPPLDGSHILASCWRPYRELMNHPNAQGVSLVIMVAIFFFGGPFLYGHAQDAALYLMDHLADLFAGAP
jgi:Zn-dependent protease